MGAVSGLDLVEIGLPTSEAFTLTMKGLVAPRCRRMGVEMKTLKGGGGRGKGEEKDGGLGERTERF